LQDFIKGNQLNGMAEMRHGRDNPRFPESMNPRKPIAHFEGRIGI
jgi:hypothetical protein